MAFAAGNVLDAVVEPVGNPDRFRQFAQAGPGLGGGRADSQRGHAQIFLHGEIRDQVVQLEDKPKVLSAQFEPVRFTARVEATDGEFT